MQTKNAIGDLVNRYRVVLRNCYVKNILMGLAVAGMLTLGGVSEAGANHTNEGSRAGAAVESTADTLVVASAANPTTLGGTLIVKNATDYASADSASVRVVGPVTWDDTQAATGSGSFTNVILVGPSATGVTATGDLTLEGITTSGGLLIATSGGTAGNLKVSDNITATLGKSGALANGQAMGTLGVVDLVDSGSKLVATGGGKFEVAGITGDATKGIVNINENTTIVSTGTVSVKEVNLTGGNLISSGAATITIDTLTAGGAAGTINTINSIDNNIIINQALTNVTGTLNLFAGKDITLGNGLNTSGGSTVNITAGTVGAGGILTSGGALTITSGGIQTNATNKVIVQAGTLTVSGDGVNLNTGSSLHISGLADITGALNLAGGAQAGLGSLTAKDAVTLAGAGSLLSVSGDATITNAATAFTINGGAQASIGGALNASGGVALAGAGSLLYVAGATDITGAFTINSGAGAGLGSLTASGGVALDGAGSLLSVSTTADIAGAFTINSGAQASIGGALNASGGVDLDGANSYLHVAGATTIANGTVLDINNGAGAYLAGNLKTDQVITVGSTGNGSSLVIGGALTNSSTTAINFNVGNAAGTGFAQVGSVDSGGGGVNFNINKGSKFLLGTDVATMNQAITTIPKDNPFAYESVFGIGGKNNDFTTASTNGLNIGDATTATAGKVDIKGKTLLVVDIRKLYAPGDSLIKANSMDISASAGLAVGGALQADRNYILVSGLGANGLTQDGTAVSGGALTLASQPPSNRMMSVGLTYNNSGGTVNLGTTLISASNTFTEMDPGLANILNDSYLNRTEGNAYLDAMMDSSVGTNASAGASIESTTKSSVMVGATSITTDVSNAGVNNVANRTSIQNLYAGNNYSLAASAGSLESTALAAWVMPMYQNTTADGFTSGKYQYGYDSDFAGASMGIDYTVQDYYRVGVAFHIGKGETTTNNSGLNAFTPTKNDFDSTGVSVYGGYAFDELLLSADVGYTQTGNSILQEALGSGVNADFDVNIITAGLRAEYNYSSTPTMDVVPYAGVRFNAVQADGYDTTYLGGTVFNTDQMDANTWAFPLGVTFTKKIITPTGWRINPNLNLGVQFTAGDLDVNQVVNVAGSSLQTTMTSEVADATTFQGGLGVEFIKENHSLILDYDLNTSSNLTSHGVSGTWRVEF